MHVAFINKSTRNRLFRVMMASQQTNRSFDFSKTKSRHIALKILYFGWDYDGLASQSDYDNSIEHHLFAALTKTCLIKSRSQCKYNRCGRTDKGVSSYGQVVNLVVRSNLIDEHDPNNIGLFSPEDYSGPKSNVTSSKRTELDYINMLNRVLPTDIKAIAWAPVRSSFSARFDCQSRSYYYIFPTGDLCIESMQQAANHLVGEHDFRNLCSFDLKNGVTNHRRTILSAHIESIKSIDSAVAGPGSKYGFHQIIIVGQAFLYHQIRCIMTILFLVGSKKEPPSIVRDLLDLKTFSAKPNFNRASALPLCLFDCKYRPEDLPLGWNYSRDAIENLIKHMKCLWTQFRVKSLMIERVLCDLESHLGQIDCGDGDSTSSSIKPSHKHSKKDCQRSTWKDFGLSCDNMSDTKYVPLLRRPRDEPLEVKIAALQAKKKSKASDD